ncbi:hypothetical protein AC578_10462 [Pseudocercospora eumusae]|uniref:Uncharacterized protein n=1 Tax=Pseudocercospora eumusae TaxID=321146 RepID=A0A139GUI8_9PEZI|nr:hypothetical protein AC578_10462 [Pseudocercospora eumusae]
MRIHARYGAPGINIPSKTDERAELVYVLWKALESGKSSNAAGVESNTANSPPDAVTPASMKEDVDIITSTLENPGYLAEIAEHYYRDKRFHLSFTKSLTSIEWTCLQSRGRNACAAYKLLQMRCGGGRREVQMFLQSQPSLTLLEQRPHGVGGEVSSEVVGFEPAQGDDC